MAAMRILGVDCGSRATGYGIVDVRRSEYRFVNCGTIRTNAREPLPQRLGSIHQALSEIIRQHSPDVAAFESIFHAQNAQSALKLGHVRGVSMLTAVETSLPVYEYTPLQVKSAVTGYGRADKSQVQQMVCAAASAEQGPGVIRRF